MTDYTELQMAAEYAAQDTIKFADESEEMRALQQFHEEVDPETVLALIAENNHLAMCARQWEEAAMQWGAERDQLKAENETLRKAALDAREFIMHEAEVRGLLDASNEVSFRHPRRQAAIAIIDAAMGNGEQS